MSLSIIFVFAIKTKTLRDNDLAVVFLIVYAYGLVTSMWTSFSVLCGHHENLVLKRRPSQKRNGARSNGAKMSGQVIIYWSAYVSLTHQLHAVGDRNWPARFGFVRGSLFEHFFRWKWTKIRYYFEIKITRSWGSLAGTRFLHRRLMLKRIRLNFGWSALRVSFINQFVTEAVFFVFISKTVAKTIRSTHEQPIFFILRRPLSFLHSWKKKH